jgi:Domain of unknown function (DUF4157)
MHTHDSEFEDGLRPKASRLESAMEGIPSARLVRAAATGRPDVLDGTAVLGLQRVVGNAGVGAVLDQDRREEPSMVQQVVGSGGGSALPDTVRTDMERRLGHDFSDVRVHTDSTADQSARSVSAQAYTVGNDVVFQRDKYDPTSAAGQTMLAHELTHVVQQRSGPVDGEDAPGGIKVSDPSDRFEREAARTAEAAMSGPAGGQLAAPGALASAGSVQRQDDEEVPEEAEGQPVAQGSFVQREEDEQEKEEEPG